MKNAYNYYCIYKPFGMLSQFTKEGDRAALSSLDYRFPLDVYPVGRLDADSEGLLLLTNNRSITAAMLDPEKGHWREYFVQVDGDIDEKALTELSAGVLITVDGKKYHTRRCKAVKINTPADLPDRNPPVRFRKEIPTSWLSLAITEGKNRQVRKMTAAVGFPTLRLIRTRIGGLALPEWHPGAVFELTEQDFFKAFDRI
jgi:23S rRNA pseudouridine2457 synthase